MKHNNCAVQTDPFHKKVILYVSSKTICFVMPSNTLSIAIMSSSYSFAFWLSLYVYIYRHTCSRLFRSVVINFFNLLDGENKKLLH